MLISVKLLTNYVIIIYTLGSVHEKFGVWIKAVPKSLQIKGEIPGRECLKCLGYWVWRKHNRMDKYHQFLLFIRSTFLYHGRPESCFQSLLVPLMNTRKVTENEIFIVKLL